MKRNNLIALILGIVVVAGIYWIKQQYAPKRLVNLRNQAIWNEAPGSPTPAPLPSPTPITIATLEMKTLEALQKYLQIVGLQGKTIREEYLPAVDRLYRQERAEIERWADDASWPVAQFTEKFGEDLKNLDSFLTAVPQDFVRLKERMEEIQKWTIQAAHDFQYAPDSPREISKEIRNRLNTLFQEIDSEKERLQSDLQKEIEKRRT